MAAAIAPTPSIAPSAQGEIIRFSPSDSQSGAFYRTTPSTCSCPDCQRKQRQDPSYRCKHMRREFPIYCGNCGVEHVCSAGDVCAFCAAQLTDARAFCAAQLTDARAFCGCGRGRRRVEGFSVCALCLADEAVGSIAPSAAQLHATAVEHTPLRLVR